jgi:transposase
MENKRKRYPKEIRDKAVRMVGEHESEYPSQWACIISIAEKLGIASETLRRWVRAAESASEPLASGMRASERMKELERENKELRRSNEILKRAAAFFGAELNRQQK